jgi:hypothetical protein
MKAKGKERLQPYEEVENWTPYTYREYPEDTVENIHAFTDFLETENDIGLDARAFPKAIERLTSKVLISVDDREIRLTEAGDFWRYNIIWEFCKS